MFEFQWNEILKHIFGDAWIERQPKRYLLRVIIIIKDLFKSLSQCMGIYSEMMDSGVRFSQLFLTMNYKRIFWTNSPVKLGFRDCQCPVFSCCNIYSSKLWNVRAQWIFSTPTLSYLVLKLNIFFGNGLYVGSYTSFPSMLIKTKVEQFETVILNKLAVRFGATGVKYKCRAGSYFEAGLEMRRLLYECMYSNELYKTLTNSRKVLYIDI